MKLAKDFPNSIQIHDNHLVITNLYLCCLIYQRYLKKWYIEDSFTADVLPSLDKREQLCCCLNGSLQGIRYDISLIWCDITKEVGILWYQREGLGVV